MSRLNRRRVVRLAAVAALGLLVGGAGYLAIRVVSAPGPRVADGWSLLAPMPDARGETAAADADGRLVVVGGMTGLSFEASADVSVYDPADRAWRSGPALPEPRHHAAAAGIDGAVYVSGGASSATGWAATPTLWALPAGGASWQALEPMPEARLGHRMVALDGRLYVVGGLAGAPTGAAGASPGPADGSVLVYDTAAGSWSIGAAMPLSRDHLAVVVVDGEIWAIGGRAGGGNYARVDIYDPATDTWRDGPPLPEPTSGAAEAVVDGVVYISGGEDPGKGLIVDRHWLLDTRVGAGASWQALPPPPLAVHGAPGANLEGRFVIVSGSTRPGGQSNTAWTGAFQELLAAR